MFNRKARFSVSQLMIAAVVVALFCESLFNNNEWWRATLVTITTGMVLNSLLAAIFTTGERRAYSLSYFVGALFFALGVYTYSMSLPYLLTVKAFDWMQAYAPTPPDEENFYIVTTTFWLQITCYSSAFVGRFWYRRTQLEKAEHPRAAH